MTQQQIAADNLAAELEAKLNACRAEGLTFKCGWNLIAATITALRTPSSGAGDGCERMREAKDLPLEVKLAGAKAITAEHMTAKANYDAACDCWDAMVAALTTPSSGVSEQDAGGVA